MPIDINGLNNSGKPQGSGDRQVQSAKQDGAASKSGAEANATSSSDKVSLTQTAARLKQLEQSLANQPAVDQQRVEGVQRALVNGAYAIDAERIAGKMIAFEQQLGPKQ